MFSGKGFTLLEVLLVIALTGIIFCISPISRGFYGHTEYETTIKKITRDLRRFRMKAICSNRTYKFRIYRDDDIFKKDNDFKSDYIFYFINEMGEEVIVYHGEYPGEYKLYKNLNEKIVKENYYSRISFTGRGTACPGTVGLEGIDGRLKKIVVSQLGRVRIES